MNRILMLCTIILSFSTFQCDDPMVQVQQPAAKISIDSVYGSFVPSQTRLRQYTKNGTIISDTTYNLYDFLVKWGSLKYLKIAPKSSVTFCVSGGCLYSYASDVSVSSDTLFLFSRLHDATRNATKEFIIPVDSGFQIESRYDTNELSVVITYTTLLRRISETLPFAAWDTITCKQSF